MENKNMEEIKFGYRDFHSFEEAIDFVIENLPKDSKTEFELLELIGRIRIARQQLLDNQNKYFKLEK